MPLARKGGGYFCQNMRLLYNCIVTTGQKVLLGIGLGLLGFSLLPIWRSGEKRRLNLFQFVGEHTIFSRKRQWVEMRDRRTGKSIWVELEENRPNNRFLYQDESKTYKGELTAHY